MASEELSHMEVMKKAKELVSSLLSDSALNDLPPDCDADEVSTLLALEQGRAITINLKRFDGEVIRKGLVQPSHSKLSNANY